MAIKRRIYDKWGTFFLTFTCHRWLSLIDEVKGYDLFYKWFNYLKSFGHHINGYVIMPNHFHGIISFRNTHRIINTTVGEGKRFIGMGMINRLTEMNRTHILSLLEEGVNKSDRKRNKKNEIWEDSFDWKACRSNDFLRQKLNYIHRNPCKGKWHLVDSLEDYEHSSARFYMCGQHAAYPVTSYLEMEDLDLSVPGSDDALWDSYTFDGELGRARL